MESKKPWFSKTLWSNLILAIGAVIAAGVPAAAEYVTAENVAMVFAVVNSILRMVTKGAIEFK